MHRVGAARLVALVGDIVCRAGINVGLHPRLLVYDCKSMRKPIDCLKPPPVYRHVVVHNPPSTLTEELLEALAHVDWSRDHVAVRVIGEEDLALLPVVLYAPQDVYVVYGQPGRGVVAVHVDQYTKTIASRVLSKFTRGERA